MFTTIYTFGEYLTHWMHKHGHTCASLSEKTNQKSRTTISRLMHDQCSPQRCAVFITELITTFPDIPEDELKCFREAVDVSRFGKEKYQAYQVFSDLVLPSGDEDTDMPICDEAPAAKQLLSLIGDEQADLLVLGCMDRRSLHALSHLLNTLAGRIRIHHYFSQKLYPDLTFLLPTVLPLLHHPSYCLTSIDKSESLTAARIAMQDAILLRTNSAQKLIIPLDSENLKVMPLQPEDDLYAFYESLLLSGADAHSRFTITYRDNPAISYVEFIQKCTSYESSRAIYQIKPDIGVELIPIDILLENFRDCIGYENADELHKIEPQLLNACRVRYNNLYSKRQPTYMFMNKTAMIAFAKTGILTDHPYFLRPFTPKERVKIFEHIIEQARKNPYFFPLMLTNPDLHQEYSFVCYDKYGLLVFATHTDYDLKSEYRETMLTTPSLIDHFISFSLNVLVKTKTDTLRQSNDFFHRLIQIALTEGK